MWTRRSCLYSWRATAVRCQSRWVSKCFLLGGSFVASCLPTLKRNPGPKTVRADGPAVRDLRQVLMERAALGGVGLTGEIGQIRAVPVLPPGLGSFIPMAQSTLAGFRRFRQMAIRQTQTEPPGLSPSSSNDNHQRDLVEERSVTYVSGPDKFALASPGGFEPPLPP